MNYDMIGIGNALVDIEVQVDDDFLKRHSLRKGGMTLSTTENQIRILEAVQGISTKISSGGSAANTVHGVSVLGGKTYYVGRVANDAYGDHYTQDMKNCGVGFSGPGAETAGTGTCVVLVTPDTERTMLTHLGISSALHPDNVDETLVRDSRVVYIEGYLWTGEETRKAAHKLAEIAQKNGVQVALSLSDSFIVDNYRDLLADFIRWNVDILFCNHVEALAMANSEDEDEAFAILQGMAETFFLTRGKQGSWAGRAGERRRDISTFPVEAIDTTGAGDLYAAGALHGLIQDLDLRDAAILGAYCSAQVVTHFGARMPIQSHTEVEKILKEYKTLQS